MNQQQQPIAKQPKVKASYILPDEELYQVVRFTLPKDMTKYREIYKILNYQIDPLETFLVQTTKLYSKLSAPLAKFPTRDKHYLAAEIKKAILDISKHMIESSEVPSLAIPNVKLVSSGLKNIRYMLSVACSLKYLSTSFHAKMQHLVEDLLNLLSMWIRVITFKP